ncbi:MAG: gamma-glutamylcyclotransferase family protein [Acidiferrobacterales bacterium]
MRHLVFVYGSLRCGERHAHLLAGEHYLGAHKTGPCYTMFSLGNWPAIMAGGDVAIVGDVFGIDRSKLAHLDAFERFPHLFVRQRIPTPYGQAWVYMFRHRPADAVTIPSGDWQDSQAEN